MPQNRMITRFADLFGPLGEPQPIASKGEADGSLGETHNRAVSFARRDRQNRPEPKIFIDCSKTRIWTFPSIEKTMEGSSKVI
jgi:hypothetical protein